MTNQDLDALAAVVLANDFEPLTWEEAPDWRRVTAQQVAKASIACCGLSCAEHARSAWTLAMTTLGWGWGPTLDVAAKRHPGIVFGELTQGGVRHWTGVVDAVRSEAKRRGVRVTGE